jgi:hypothetical protein
MNTNETKKLVMNQANTTAFTILLLDHVRTNPSVKTITVEKLKKMSQDKFKYVFPTRSLRAIAEAVGLTVSNGRSKRVPNGTAIAPSNIVIMAEIMQALARTTADIAKQLGLEENSPELHRLRAIYASLSLVRGRQSVDLIQDEFRNRMNSVESVNV